MRQWSRPATTKAPYVKSVPADISGDDGTSTVYVVGERADTPTDVYDWYAQRMYVLCGVGMKNDTVIAKLGPWAPGHTPSNDHLAIAFYRRGKLLKSYSTLDIIGDSDAYRRTVSHYDVFDSIAGFQWTDGPRPGCCEILFIATLQGDRQIRFNIDNGMRLPEEPTEPADNPSD